jgi:hypothetical protein
MGVVEFPNVPAIEDPIRKFPYAKSASEFPRAALDSTTLGSGAENNI